jgi:anti-sigma-K factor RskA
METKEYIESGVLELFVYGLLSDAENEEVVNMAKNNQEIEAEIVSIEKAIVNISTSFSPFLSADNFEKIKSKLDLKYAGKAVDLKPKSNLKTYTGWAAAAVFLIGMGYQYNKQIEIENQIVKIENEKSKINKSLLESVKNNNQTLRDLAIVQDIKNTVVQLGGQAVAPTSSAKVYWNKETQTVYIDASGLPKPPEGMVYQVWSLKLKPTLTPTSIGLLDDFETENNKIFAVSKTADAEAFGITLEPKGGSLSPTMEQLYTLGKV